MHKEKYISIFLHQIEVDLFSTLQIILQCSEQTVYKQLTVKNM